MRTVMTNARGTRANVWLSAALALVSVGAMIACDSATQPGGQLIPLVDEITVSPPAVTIYPGDSVQLSATAYDSWDVEVETEFAWATSDPTVATVTADGVLVGVAEGAVTVTASAGGKQGSTEVAVGAAVAGVIVAPAPVTVAQGATVQLTARAVDHEGNTLSPTVTWTSADPTIAIVSGAGVVTGITPGATAVTATAAHVSGSAGVTVTLPATTITISGGSGNSPLEIGLTLQLSATAYDVNGTPVNVTITWSTSDAKIVTVDQTGLVTAVGAGTGIVTAAVGAVRSTLEIKVTGETTTAGNNISWPLVFAEGIGLTGSPVATDPGVRPLTTETDALAELATIPVANPTAPFFYSANAADTVWYESNIFLQGTLNVWRAPIIDGTGQPKYTASAGWGDNLVSQSINVGKKVRIEVALSATGVAPLPGYSMPYVVNASTPEEIQGTDGTPTEPLVPLIYTVGPTFTVELNGSQVSSEVMTPEVNVAGRLVYGGQWIPAAAGSYTLRFRLASGANVEITGVTAGGEVVSPQETAIDVTVVP